MASKRWWQFWKKKQPSNVIEPLLAAAIPLDRLFSREKPFDEWKPPDTQVLPEHEDFIKTMVYGYQLFTYLQLIEAKFGLEIARIIREYQIIALNRLPEGDAGEQTSLLLQIITDAWKTANDKPIKIPERPDLHTPIEVTMALYLLGFTKGSPYYIPPEHRTKDSTNDHIPPKVDFHGLEWTLAECLLHGKNAAVEVFGPIIQLIELKPETVSDLHRPTPSQKTDRQPCELIWSQNPGFYERHLQRKYQNPLFPPASRVVTQGEIDTARMRNLSDAETLRKELHHLIKEETSGIKAADSSTLDKIREKIDDLMQRAAEIGGDGGDEIGKSLASLRSGLIADWRKGLQDIGNTQALNALEEAEQFVDENIKPFRNQFVAQMSRMEPDDVVPALLSEDLETIGLVLKQMGDGSDAQKQFRAAAISLLAENLQANPPILQLQEKLRVLGVPEDLFSRLGGKEE